MKTKKFLRSALSLLLTLLMLISASSIGLSAAQVDIVETGYSFAKDTIIYFDTTGLNWPTNYKVEFMIGHSNWSATYEMTKVSNTNLYRYKFTGAWDNCTQFCFIANSSAWGDEGNSPSHRAQYASYKTSVKTISGNYSGSFYGGTDGSLTYQSGVSGFHSNQIAWAYGAEAGSSSYSEMATAGTVKVAGYYISGTSSTSGTSRSATSSGSSASATASLVKGSTVTLTATPSNGYTFVGWYDGSGNQLSTDATYTYSQSADQTTYAYFQKQVTNYSFTASAGEGGSVSPTSGTVTAGESVQLSATPNTGYTFDKWTFTDGEGNTGSATTSFKPTAEGATAVASFTKNTYTVTASVSDSDGGSVSPTSTTVEHNGSATFVATVNEGYALTDWEVDGVSQGITNTSFTLTSIIKNNIKVEAIIEQVPTYTVKGVVGSGKGSVSPTQQSIEQTSSIEYSAAPDDGYKFSHWEISGSYTGTIDVNSPTFIVTPTADNFTATAYFVQVWTVTFIGFNGEVLKTQTEVVDGTGATAPSAPAVAHYTFKEWDTDFSSVKDNLTVNAVYEGNTYTVSASVNGTGGTAVTSKSSVTYPTTVTLTATAGNDYVFNGWTINGAYEIVEGSTSSTTFVIRPEADIVAQANFDEGQYLTVYTYSDDGYDKLTLKESNGTTTKDVLNKVAQPEDVTFNGVTWDSSTEQELTNGYSSSVTAQLSGEGGIPAGTGNLVVFNNTLGWDSVHLYTKSSDMWNGNNGATTKGATHYTMTRLGDTNYWYAYVNPSYQNVLFLKHQQNDYDNVYQTSAAYRSDYSTSNPMFTPSTSSNQSTNGTTYYSNGTWGTIPSISAESPEIHLEDTLYNNGDWAGVSEVWIYQNGTSSTVTTRRSLLTLIADCTAEYNGGVNAKDYTASTWTAFVNAYNDAYTKSGAKASNQTAIDQAEADLREAYGALVLQAYFNLTVTQTGGNGTVAVGNGSVTTETGTIQVAQNKKVTAKITAPDGYYIVSVTGAVEASNQASPYETEVTVSADGTINVTYAKNPKVSAEQNQNGTITINGSETPVDVAYGKDADLVISAPDLYFVQSVTINSIPVYNDSDETKRSFTYTLENVTADTNIVVTYGKCSTYEVTIEQYPEEGGKLYYDGELIPYEGMVIEVVAGDNVTITAEPNSGYGINYWVADSQTSGRELTYTFSAISADHTLDIEWQKLQNVTVTVVTRPNSAATSTASSEGVSASTTITVLQFDKVTLTTTLEDPCYQFVRWTIEGAYANADGTTKANSTFNIIANGGAIKATANYEKVARKIYLENAAGWSQPYIHYWGGEVGSNWPGEKMTKDATTDYWVAYIPLDTTNIQFNDGTNQNQKEFKGIDSKNLYNNSTMSASTYVENGYYLQGNWNGKTYSGYDLQKFEDNGDGTYSITIEVTSTTDGYIYVNPTDKDSHFWNAQTLNATGNPQTLTATGAYQTSPNYVKVEIDTTSYTKAYDVTFTFNPTTGEFSWTKAENVPTISVIGTDGRPTNSADSNMVTSNGRVGKTDFDIDTVNRINYYTLYAQAQVVPGESVTFTTQVNPNADGTYDYYVAGWVINGTEFVSATSLGRGLYSGSYVFTEDDSTVVPVYFHTNEWLAANNVSTVTVYAVADMGITNWNKYFSAYTWYKVSGVTQYEQFGPWSGQLMIPVTGLDNVYYTYIETATKDGVKISGITFNNYSKSQDSGGYDTSIDTNYNRLQTYDYYEFISLLEDGKENITFVIKDTNDTYNSNRVNGSTVDITNGNWDFVQYTDYSGLKTDIFGNDIEDIDSTLSDSNALYVIQAGDKNYSGVGNLDGQWYVDCYLYNASGTYLGKCYSYELHDEDSAIWTTLAAYENQRAYFSYEHVSDARYDGEWYGDSDLSVTINLAVNVALMGADDQYVIDTEGNVNEADYGTGYIEATYQNMDVTRGTVVTLSAMPKVGYKFVGWYSADGTLFSNNTTVTVTAAIGTTYTAVFEALAEGSFYVNHYIYQGLGNTNYYIPDVHGGNAVLYVGIQNITQGTGTTLIKGNSASLEATEGDELYITIATDAAGAHKFYAWYTDAIDGDGNPTFEEVGVDSDDNLYNNNGTVVGRSDIVYFQFKHTVGELFSMNLYSDLIPQSIDVTLVYKYYDRYDNIKTYSVPYILTDREVEGFAGNNSMPYTPAFISSTDGSWVNTIIANAPYVEDYYKDTTWIISSAMYDTMTFNLWATQPYTMYTVTSQIGSDVIINQVPYNTVIQLDAMKLSANATREGFWYNDVDHDGKYDETVDIILTYRSHYGYRVTQDMSINYENKYDTNYDFDVSLDAPVYGREQTTDSKGNITTDKIYVDYIINILTPHFYGRWNDYTPYYNGQVVTEDWQGNHCTIETLLREGVYESISYGIILEQVTSLDIANDYDGVYSDAKLVAESKGFGTATDEETLKAFVEAGQNGWIINGSRYGTLMDATSHNITNKNRIQFVVGFNNTEKNQNRFYNIYSYVTVTTYDGVKSTYISNVQTLNIYETAVKDATVSDNTTFA